jgi:DNA end-binding protein Ku
MPPRPTGTATISFGLVSIPVNLFSASESKAAISFNMLHDEDHARVKQQLVCSKDGAIVERDHIVKGYEFEKGQYVVFTPEELKALEEQSNQIMEITEFVPLSRLSRTMRFWRSTPGQPRSESSTRRAERPRYAARAPFRST